MQKNREVRSIQGTVGFRWMKDHKRTEQSTEGVMYA